MDKAQGKLIPAEAEEWSRGPFQHARVLRNNTHNRSRGHEKNGCGDRLWAHNRYLDTWVQR